MAHDKLLAEWFWIDRWDGSSASLLPMEARGVYREMLSQSWRRGGKLPQNFEEIRRAIRAEKSEWRRSWPLVSKYWRVEGDYLVNDTQLEVYAEAQRIREGASVHGKAAAKARWAMPGDKPPSPSPSPIVLPSLKTESVVPRARRNNLAFAGRVLEVPRFLDSEFVKRLNRTDFDLTGLYLRLDKQLQETGEQWDLGWIRRHFEAEAPTPVATPTMSRQTRALMKASAEFLAMKDDDRVN